ncbi:hypothetical protein [Burkholderia phage FLC9]|nr:hypothetical protein [Burkholderia phage FLC9]
MGKIAYRRVAPDWVHPTYQVYGEDHYRPLRDGTKLIAEQAQWDRWQELWNAGLVEDDSEIVALSQSHKAKGIVLYYGARPEASRYTPAWTPEQATGWQVYEEVTEGTPITKVYPDLNTMAREIAEECGHSYEAMRNKILATLEHGWWYVSVPEFEFGGKYYGRQFKEV